MRQSFDIPKLIKSLRDRMDLTQEKFAHKLGITFGTVNSWENGRRFPQPYLLNRLLELNKKVRGRKKADK